MKTLIICCLLCFSLGACNKVGPNKSADIYKTDSLKTDSLKYLALIQATIDLPIVRDSYNQKDLVIVLNKTLKSNSIDGIRTLKFKGSLISIQTYDDVKSKGIQNFVVFNEISSDKDLTKVIVQLFPNKLLDVVFEYRDNKWSVFLTPLIGIID